MTVEQEVANLTTAVDNLTSEVNVKKVALEDAVDDSETARDASQAWAESATEPGGAGTKSAKTWSEVAENFSVGAFFLTDETSDLLYLTTNADTVTVVAETNDTFTLEIA